jgi:hypothetical protein
MGDHLSFCEDLQMKLLGQFTALAAIAIISIQMMMLPPL